MLHVSGQWIHSSSSMSESRLTHLSLMGPSLIHQAFERNWTTLRICAEQLDGSAWHKRARSAWQLALKLGSLSFAYVWKWVSRSKALIMPSGEMVWPKEPRQMRAFAVSSTSASIPGAGFTSVSISDV